MKRRNFLKKATLTATTIAAKAATTIAAPYILPTGRLFAATGARIVNHVVFVLFGGGIRNQESVEQRYTSMQNGSSATGNVMNNMLGGAAPTNDLDLFGGGMWDPVLNTPLSSQGALFREVVYRTGTPGHYNGHTVAMTGQYSETNVNLNINPANPTIFEYYRKHNDPVKSALNTWWISEGLGPYPSLNHSTDSLYGAAYGANYLRPASVFINPGQDQFGNIQTYQPDDVARISRIKQMLDSNFEKGGTDLPGIQNTPENRELIKTFLSNTIQEIQGGNFELARPDGSNIATGDMVNISSGWKVLKEFSPELTVINTTNLDVCHTDFGQYLNLLHRADYGVGWLWDKIQGPEGAAAGLKDDTIMICMPEHGRNFATNNQTDQFGMRALDHTNEDINGIPGYSYPYENARRIFALMVGPEGVINQQAFGSPGSPVGESIDIAPTIAHILGFNDNIPNGRLPGRVLEEAFL